MLQPTFNLMYLQFISLRAFVEYITLWSVLVLNTGVRPHAGNRRFRRDQRRLATLCLHLLISGAKLRPSSAPVAQLDRALPSEGRGHTFESCRVRQFLSYISNS